MKDYRSQILQLPSILKGRLKRRETLNSIFVNTSWYLLDRLMRVAVGLLVIICMARYLGPADYGDFLFAQAFASIFMGFGALGLDGVVIRDLGKTESRNEILGSAFFLKLIGGILSIALTFLAINLLRPYDRLIQSLICILAIANLFKTFDVIEFWFKAKMEGKYPVVVKYAAFLVSSALILAVIVFRGSLMAFCWAALVETVLGSVGLYWVYCRKVNEPFGRWRLNLHRCKQLLQDSWPIALAGIFILVIMQADRIILKQLVGNAEVGYYSTAARLSEAWYFLPAIFGAAVMPPLTKESKISAEKYKIKVERVYGIMSLISAGFIVMVILLSKTLIHLLYGSHYGPAAGIFLIHAWTLFFVLHIGIRRVVFTIQGLQGYIALFSFLAMVINLAANYWLVPLFGGRGAAFAAVLAWGSNLIIFPIFFKDTRESVWLSLRSLLFLFPHKWKNLFEPVNIKP